MINTEFLSRINPDFEISIEEDGRLSSIGAGNKHILTALDINIDVFNTSLYLNDFISILSNDKSDSSLYEIKNLINTSKTGLLFINSKSKQQKGLLVFLVRYHRCRFQFYNLILLCNQFSSMFESNCIWNKIHSAIEQNQHNFYTRNVETAYKSIFPLYLISKISFNEIKAKVQYELGEFLHYFSGNGDNSICNSTGRNMITKTVSNINYDMNNAPKNINVLINGNTLVENYFYII